MHILGYVIDLRWTPQAFMGKSSLELKLDNCWVAHLSSTHCYVVNKRILKRVKDGFLMLLAVIFHPSWVFFTWQRNNQCSYCVQWRIWSCNNFPIILGTLRDSQSPLSHLPIDFKVAFSIRPACTYYCKLWHIAPEKFVINAICIISFFQLPVSRSVILHNKLHDYRPGSDDLHDYE